MSEYTKKQLEYIDSMPWPHLTAVRIIGELESDFERLKALVLILQEPPSLEEHAYAYYLNLCAEMESLCKESEADDETD